jgi:hypothetical protein
MGENGCDDGSRLSLRRSFSRPPFPPLLRPPLRDRSRGTARLKILSEVLAVSEAGLAYVFEALQSAGLIAREQQFDFAKIVDQRYLVQSRVLQDRGTVRR